MNGTLTGSMRVHEMLRFARERGASDVHFSADEKPALRIDGALSHRSEASLSADEIEMFLSEQLTEEDRSALARRGCCDVVVRAPGAGVIRLHVFRAVGRMRCAARLLPERVPTLDSWDLPGTIERLAMRRSGLVLVVGPTGSGKTTLLASMMDALNSAHSRVVVAFEDPIEYLHRSDKCQIAQCEIGRDAPDYRTAIVGVLRADPDVILIGELRDTASFQSALTVAETGHLVLASLHTLDAPQALERIVDSFPAEGRDHIRVQLSQTLAGIVALRLVPRAHSRGRRAAAEILLATDAVRNLIREGKTHQLRSVMQTGKSFAMQTLEMHLSELVERGEITAETAADCSQHPSELAFI